MINLLAMTRHSLSRASVSQALLLTFTLSLASLVLPTATRAHTDCDGSGAKQGVKGTEFLLCFEQNTIGTFSFVDGGYLDIYLASVDDPATVTITSKRYPSLNQVIVLQPHSSQTYRITDDPSFQDLWINSTDVPDPRVVHVVSSAPIICYGMDHRPQSSDAFLAFPRSSCAADYRIMSYQNSTVRHDTVADATSGDMPSEFAVAAFEDNTTVTITPSVAAIGGHPAGMPYSVTLQSGECVQVQTDRKIDGLDLSGSSVVSNHAVAVYAGHARTEMPSGFALNSGSTSRDMLLEAMPPTSSWGHAFVLDAFDIADDGTKSQDGDVVRVLALNDNTTVKVNGNVWDRPFNHNGYWDTTVFGPMLI